MKPLSGSAELFLLMSTSSLLPFCCPQPSGHPMSMPAALFAAHNPGTRAQSQLRISSQGPLNQGCMLVAALSKGWMPDLAGRRISSIPKGLRGRRRSHQVLCSVWDCASGCCSGFHRRPKQVPPHFSQLTVPQDTRVICPRHGTAR